ncbi:MAG: aldehyde dehydrogenase family protein, partial [Candidatus Omnitrophota bacterium]
MKILNWIGNGLKPSQNGYFEKRSPHDGSLLRKVSRSSGPEVDEAVAVAKKAQVAWAQTPAVKRGELLRKIASRLEENKALVASIVTAETGKSPSLAIGETEGAVSLGYFFAGEGQRLYGRTTTSSVVNRRSATVRQPIGVAGLFVPANTPIANVAWKVFPALICGNAAVVKASEDAPLTAWIFARIAYEAGLPGGVLSVVQGLGPEAGGALASHPDVGVLSFTGSTDVGKKILGFANERLARVSLELGGKNPFVVCDDADLERAADWAVLSAFSNAGQRCASASRLIIFKSVYNKFKTLILGKTKKLKVGPSDVDD